MDRESRGQGRQKEKSGVHFNGMQSRGCVCKCVVLICLIRLGMEESSGWVEYVKSAAI